MVKGYTGTLFPVLHWPLKSAHLAARLGQSVAVQDVPRRALESPRAVGSVEDPLLGHGGDRIGWQPGGDTATLTIREY